MIGKDESSIKDEPASYLNIAEFIKFSGSQNKQDLHELWRRIIFNISVSNTDDHLRNHGFILNSSGWTLSPAFDLNPSTDKNGLALNIDSENNDLSFDLARSVGEYFDLSLNQMNEIIKDINTVIKDWRQLANNCGINRSEQDLMAAAFNY